MTFSSAYLLTLDSNMTDRGGNSRLKAPKDMVGAIGTEHDWQSSLMAILGAVRFGFPPVGEPSRLEPAFPSSRAIGANLPFSSTYLHLQKSSLPCQRHHQQGTWINDSGKRPEPTCFQRCMWVGGGKNEQTNGERERGSGSGSGGRREGAGERLKE